jgi:predicted lactoylglutathione lyase
MTKQIWLNLPVKDLTKSKAFFSKLGFTFNEKYGNGPDSACLLVGQNNFVIMLFTEAMFEQVSGNKICDTKTGTEVLLSIDAESREEVDELAKKAVNAGGILFAKPAEHQGWMYGCGFSDLDGHRWNVLYMDMSKMS